MNTATIYIIKNKDPENNHCYVGSTKNINKREYAHKNDSQNINSNLYNTKKARIIREFGGWENWNIIPLIEINYNTNKEKLFKEKEFYNLIKPTMNSQKIILTPEEKIKYKKERYKKRHYCEICEISVLVSHKARHEKSNKHYMKVLELDNLYT